MDLNSDCRETTCCLPVIFDWQSEPRLRLLNENGHSLLNENGYPLYAEEDIDIPGHDSQNYLLGEDGQVLLNEDGTPLLAE